MYAPGADEGGLYLNLHIQTVHALYIFKWRMWQRRHQETCYSGPTCQYRDCRFPCCHAEVDVSTFGIVPNLINNLIHTWLCKWQCPHLSVSIIILNWIKLHSVLITWFWMKSLTLCVAEPTAIDCHPWTMYWQSVPYIMFQAGDERPSKQHPSTNRINWNQ